MKDELVTTDGDQLKAKQGYIRAFYDILSIMDEETQ